MLLMVNQRVWCGCCDILVYHAAKYQFYGGLFLIVLSLPTRISSALAPPGFCGSSPTIHPSERSALPFLSTWRLNMQAQYETSPRGRIMKAHFSTSRCPHKIVAYLNIPSYNSQGTAKCIALQYGQNITYNSHINFVLTLLMRVIYMHAIMGAFAYHF